MKNSRICVGRGTLKKGVSLLNSAGPSAVALHYEMLAKNTRLHYFLHTFVFGFVSSPSSGEQIPRTQNDHNYQKINSGTYKIQGVSK